MKFPVTMPDNVGFQPAGRGFLPLLKQSAFSLVEVTVAVGIAGFCLLAIFGLLPVGLNSNNASIDQTTAANLARGIVSDIRTTTKATPPADEISPYYKITVPATATATHTLFLKEDGSLSGTVDTVANGADNPKFRAMITFVPPAAGQKAATYVRLFITWPALADRNPTTGAANPPPAAALPTKFAGSYEVVTALDRN